MKFILTTSLCLFFMFIISGQAIAQKKKAIKGNGNIVTENRNLSSFSGIHVGGAFDVVIQKGNSHKVEIEADENLMSHIKMEVKGNTLKINMDGWVQKVNKLSLVITTKELNHLRAGGATDVEVMDVFSSDEFELDASGASDVKISVNTDKMKVNVSGSSDLELKGMADDMALNVSGASDLKAGDFQTKSINVMASGSSSARIYASQEITAIASGSSDINCVGNPSQKSVQTSGSSDININ